MIFIKKIALRDIFAFVHETMFTVKPADHGHLFIHDAHFRWGSCQSALNIDPVSASNIDPLLGIVGRAPGGDA